MANKDLLKQAIAEAKTVREAAIANAKEALEETLTPHLKDMLAAKLQEMEDKEVDEEAVNEIEEEEAVEENTSGFTSVEEAEEETEDDSEESEDEVEDTGMEAGEEEAVEGDEDLGDLTVDQFKDMIRDIIAQELGHSGEGEMGMDMDGGDIEGMGDEESMEEPELDATSDEEEIDLDELLRELESVSEMSYDKEEEMEEGKHKEEEMEEEKKKHHKMGEEKKKHNKMEEELKEAMDTIETLRKDLQEVNLLNSKLLYVNKIFKANNLTESQKVNIIAAFDKAETVKEVKLVFETVSENVGPSRKDNVTESKVKGMASKATGTTASKPEIIAENSAVYRMQVLAGIKPRQF